MSSVHWTAGWIYKIANRLTSLVLVSMNWPRILQHIMCILFSLFLQMFISIQFLPFRSFWNYWDTLSLSLSLFLSLSLSLSHTHTHSLSLSLCFCFSRSVSVSLSLFRLSVLSIFLIWLFVLTFFLSFFLSFHFSLAFSSFFFLRLYFILFIYRPRNPTFR